MLREGWLRPIGLILILTLVATMGSFDPIKQRAEADEKLKAVIPETATSTAQQPKSMKPLAFWYPGDPSLPEMPDEIVATPNNTPSKTETPNLTVKSAKGAKIESVDFNAYEADDGCIYLCPNRRQWTKTVASGSATIPKGTFKQNQTINWNAKIRMKDGSTLNSPTYWTSTGSKIQTRNIFGNLETKIVPLRKAPSPRSTLSTQPKLQAGFFANGEQRNVRYKFTVSAVGSPSLKWDSGWISSSSVSPKLPWNRHYTWSVSVRDASERSGEESRGGVFSLIPAPDDYAIAPQETAVRSMDVSTGSSVITRDDAVTMTYESRNHRTSTSAFGLGWSSVTDSSLIIRGERLIARLPDGHAEAFETNPDGTFAPAPGTSGRLKKRAGGKGWSMTTTDDTTYDFTSSGDLEAVSTPEGGKETVQRSSNGQVSGIKDENSKRLTRFAWSGGRISSATVIGTSGGTGAKWTYSYIDGRLVKACGPLGSNDCTSYSYGSGDQSNALTQQTTPGGKTTKLTYSGSSTVSSVVTPDNTTWKMGRSTQGDKTTVKLSGPASSGTQTYVLDQGRRPVKLTDSEGGEQQWEYDARGRLTRYTTPTGGGMELSYNYHNQLTQRRVQQDGQSASLLNYEYFNDGANAGRVSKVKGPLYSQEVSYKYHSSGQLEEVNDNGLISRFTYTSSSDAATGGGTVPVGLVKKSTVPGEGSTNYSYNSSGDLVSTVDAAELTTTFKVDEFGRPTSMSLKGKNEKTADTWAYKYAADDEISRIDEPKVTDAVNGNDRQLSTTFERDAAGNTTAEVYTDLVSDTTNRTDYTYDALNRLTSTKNNAGTVTENITYDASGKITSESRPGPSGHKRAVTKYTYDKMGRMLTATAAGIKRQPEDSSSEDIVEERSYDKSGNMTERTDNRGQRWRYDYDLAGNLLKETATGAFQGTDDIQVSYVYDAAGNVIKQTLPGEQQLVTEFRYNTAGQLTNKQVNAPDTGPSKAHTRRHTYEYNDQGQLTKTALMDGNDRDAVTQELGYDKAGNTTSVKLSKAGQVEADYRSVYDSRGRLVQKFDPRSAEPTANASTQYEYDAVDNPVLTRLPEASITTTKDTPQTVRATERRGYDAFGRTTKAIDASGAESTFSYDSVGNLTKSTSPKTSRSGSTVPTTTRKFDTAGNLTSMTDPIGRVHDYDYDSLNRMISAQIGEKDSDKKTSASWYFAGDDLVRTVDTGGHERSVALNKLGQPTQLIDGKGDDRRMERRSYDRAGNVTSSTDPTGATTRTSYNVFNEPILVTDPDGMKTTTHYDIAGNPSEIVDGKGQSTRNLYNGRNQLLEISKTGPNKEVDARVTYSYDAAGNQTEVSGPQGTGQKQEWNALGQLVSVEFGDSTKQSWTYDALGRSTSFTDPRDNTTKTPRTPAGDIASRIEPSVAGASEAADRTWSYTYDAVGRPVGESEPGGFTTSTEYTRDDQVRKITSKGPDTADVVKEFGYDSAGNLTSATAGKTKQTFDYDKFNQLTEASGNGVKTKNSYDKAGRLVSTTDEGGTTDYTFTKGGRLSTVDDHRGYNVTNSYDKAGQLSKRQSSKKDYQESFDYNANGQITKNTHSLSNKPFYENTYAYDPAGRLEESRSSPAAVSGAGKRTYSYDYRSRVTRWSDTDGTSSKYQYDDANNLTEIAGRTLEYDAQNRVTKDGKSTIGWSSRGQQTSAQSGASSTAYSYDAAGRLTSDGANSYDYDAFDRLMSADETVFSYAGLEREPSTSGDTSVSRADGVALAIDGQAVVSNNRGDILSTLDASKPSLTSVRSYSPYGAVNDADAEASFGFQGNWTAPGSGLVRMGSRWYVPGRGGFMTRDTTSDLPTGQENRFSYAMGNPVQHTDPSGEFVPACAVPQVTSICVGAGAGAAVGSAVPGVGTAAGAVVGGVVGGLVSAAVIVGGLSYAASRSSGSRSSSQLSFDFSIPSWSGSGSGRTWSEGGGSVAGAGALARSGGNQVLNAGRHASAAARAGASGASQAAAGGRIGRAGGAKARAGGELAAAGARQAAAGARQVAAGARQAAAAAAQINQAATRAAYSARKAAAAARAGAKAARAIASALDRMRSAFSGIGTIDLTRRPVVNVPEGYGAYQWGFDVPQNMVDPLSMDAICSVSELACSAASDRQAATCGTSPSTLETACRPERPKRAGAGAGMRPPTIPSASQCHPDPPEGGVQPGDVGSYREITRARQRVQGPGTGLEAHHMPQARLLEARFNDWGVSRRESPAIVLHKEDHMRTRTYSNQNLWQQEINDDYRDTLERDYDDLRGMNLCFDVDGSIERYEEFLTERFPHLAREAG